MSDVRSIDQPDHKHEWRSEVPWGRFFFCACGATKEKPKKKCQNLRGYCGYRKDQVCDPMTRYPDTFIPIHCRERGALA